jgi:hypothetical protein
MCYHRLYIYSTCAHACSGELVSPCRRLSTASISPLSPSPNLFCSQRQYHPYHTLRFNTLCYMCNRDRCARLRTLISSVDPSPASDTWTWSPVRKTWRGFADLRNRLREDKLLERGRLGGEGEAEAASVKATITAPEADLLNRELQRAVSLHEQRLNSITGIFSHSEF